METFLIKSAITMAVLLGLYYLLLEREKMHKFNRFYLLGALVFSLAIPFITVITHVVEVNFAAQPAPENTIIGDTTTETPVDYWFFIGCSIYILVTFVLAVRFVKNIWHFTQKAMQNQKIDMSNATLVLLEKKTLPHTFLNWIFINREEYENRIIEDELYTHEYTHVKQKHTLDILFIEVLKTIFWFNPLLYCYKKAIQLNHEFLADEKVIDMTANTAYYQSLLLDKVSVGTPLSLASNLNFSITKQRFIMMTKTTSIAKAGLLKACIVPVVAGLMFLLCAKTIAQQSPQPKLTPEQETKLEKFRMSPEEEAQLKKTNPDAFSDDPAVRLKSTEFSFTDAKGNTITKKGYDQLNEEQKKKVASAPKMSAGTMRFFEDQATTDPEFPGGKDAFYSYVLTGIKIPEIKNDQLIKLTAKFTVQKDGSLSDYEIEYKGEMNEEIKGLLPQLESDIKGLLKKSPAWIPATQNGKPVIASQTLPISIMIKT